MCHSMTHSVPLKGQTSEMNSLASVDVNQRKLCWPQWGSTSGQVSIWSVAGIGASAGEVLFRCIG